MFDKKYLILSMVFLFGVLLISNSVSAVCCEETTSGQFCQQVDASQCKSGVKQAPTSCDQTDYCASGTCVDVDRGSCVSNTPRTVCEKDGGHWYAEDKENLLQCRQGCCFYGDKTTFVTQTECNQIGTNYGVATSWDSSIKDEFTCLSLSNPKAEGACVFDGEVRTCRMTSKEECVSQGGEFSEGYLCTASHLSTNCAKTGNTICGEDGKVYFLDSCGNKANVYDEDMFSEDPNEWTVLMEEYWEKIQEPLCTVKDLRDGVSCGNCDYLSVPGTTCRDYKEVDYSNLNPPLDSVPEYGDYICADLGCYYDKGDGRGVQRYDHGESFCANTPGTYYKDGHGLLAEDLKEPLRLSPEVLEDLKSLEGLYKYNLPGSRYVLLRCLNGEIHEEPCADYRNEVCVEGVLLEGVGDDFRVAQCFPNRWQRCTTLESRSECEDPNDENDCKWLEGHRWDRKNVNDNKEYSERQGSCVPLIPPGLNFWDEASAQENSKYCQLASVVEMAIYETWWVHKRNNFKDLQPKDAAKRCIEDCYAIPGFGNKSSSETYSKKELINFWLNGKDALSGEFKEAILSHRKGYYCHKAKNENKTEVGSAKELACLENDKKRRDIPVFMTHRDWINFLWERTKSLGDCGYKPNLYGKYSSNQSEVVSVIFQKLDQDLKVKDGEPMFDPEKINKEELGGQKIYVGNVYTGDEENYRFKKGGFWWQL